MNSLASMRNCPGVQGMLGYIFNLGLGRDSYFCQGSKPVLESFNDIQCVCLEDSRRHCIFL